MPPRISQHGILRRWTSRPVQSYAAEAAVFPPWLCIQGCETEHGDRGRNEIAVPGLQSPSHLKTVTNGPFPLIDLIGHSGRIAEVLAAPVDSCPCRSRCIQNVMQYSLVKKAGSASGLYRDMFVKSLVLKKTYTPQFDCFDH